MMATPLTPLSVMHGEKRRTTITQHINGFIFYLYLIINEGISFFFSAG